MRGIETKAAKAAERLKKLAEKLLDEAEEAVLLGTLSDHPFFAKNKEDALSLISRIAQLLGKIADLEEQFEAQPADSHMSEPLTETDWSLLEKALKERKRKPKKVTKKPRARKKALEAVE